MLQLFKGGTQDLNPKQYLVVFSMYQTGGLLQKADFKVLLADLAALGQLNLAREQ